MKFSLQDETHLLQGVLRTDLLLCVEEQVYLFFMIENGEKEYYLEDILHSGI